MKRYSYFNTTNSTGQDLTDYEDKAKSQEDRILAWIRKYQCEVTPTNVLQLVFHNQVPITSVRRALTNLTNAGELVKTSRQVKGPYGRPEHVWKLPAGQQRLF